MKNTSILPAEIIEKKIYLIRNQKVMLDRDLAFLYNVPTKVLKQSVKRNINRFPEDFMFELTKEEENSLRSQFVTLKRGEHSKYLSFAFTEQGISMLSSVLNSGRAISVNIEIMRTFVKIREMLMYNKDLARRLDELEKKYDTQFRIVFDALRELIKHPEKENKPIGFLVKESAKKYAVLSKSPEKNMFQSHKEITK